MRTLTKRSECPLSSSLDIFGDKWSLLIIRDMMFFNKSTYGEFLKSAEGVATNILATRLQNLEENKLIVKLEHPDSKAKVLYKLTQKAIDLLPIIVEIHLWAEKYFDIPSDIKAMIKETKKDKQEFIKAMTKQLKVQASLSSK
ncbi:MAG TPA: helix-turn-helix domain-containing protein [Saprospiraceae bacterium]|nr:helix-turn-helix domain-containing protein [Saprospiraceae bacterium]HMU06205.1 helix-turn-helix domain-containing protein [Saprospiraceae bacterium]